MTKILKDDSERSDSPAVANCRMNCEWQLTGGNSCARDLGFSPVEFLRERFEESVKIRWLDLCCGQGRALIEVATEMTAESERVEILGIDLAGLFLPHDAISLTARGRPHTRLRGGHWGRMTRRAPTSLVSPQSTRGTPTSFKRQLKLNHSENSATF